MHRDSRDPAAEEVELIEIADVHFEISTIVVIGADYPQFSLAKAVDALERLDMNRSEKDKILYGDAQALFAPKTR